ncbi:MAG: cupin domain-containing protein [Acidobacteriota bacterium]|nr:cupin domain-containing protein [Acidobacteriota bacterium]
MPIIKKKDQPVVEVFKGVFRHTLGCGKDVLMAKFEYANGSKVPSHKHSHEQVTTILKGKQKIIISVGNRKEEFIVREGDTFVVPANFEHEHHSLEETVTIDSWSLTL